MTSLPEAQLEVLERPDPIGIIYPGMQNTINQQMTCNKLYFAYSTLLSVYVYEASRNRLISIIQVGHDTISTISFSEVRCDILVIAYRKAIHVVNVTKNELISTIPLTEPVLSIGWTKHDQQIICFTRSYKEYTIYNIDNGVLEKSHGSAFESIRVMSFARSEPTFWIGGNCQGTVTRINDNLEGDSQRFTERGAVVASVLDPNSDSNCLIVWARGAWALFEGRSLQIMNDVKGLSYTFSAATWSSVLPGQFITGDKTIGIIRIWNPASDTPIEAISLHTSGILKLMDFRGNLLIGFEDGTVAIYDLKKRHFIFHNKAGHTNTIFGIQFLPTSKDVFVTAGGEGALCTWSASSRKQIDRICPPRDLGGIFCMDVSPGGGLAVCGYSTGKIGLFSLQTRTLISEIQVTNNRIISVSFNPRCADEILCVSDFGFAGIFNIKKKEVTWKCAGSYSCLSGRFSPLVENEWVLTGKNGHVYVWRDGDLVKDLSEGNEDCYGVAWSPANPDQFVTSDNGGNVILWNTSSNTNCVIGQHTGKARAIAFHPIFTNVVVSGGFDNQVMIHDTESESVLCSFEAHSTAVYSLCFSPENPHLMISGGSDSTIKFWSLDRMFTAKMIQHVIRGDAFWIRPLESHQQLIKLAKRAARVTSEKIVFDSNDIMHINDIGRLAAKKVEKSVSSSPHETRLIKRAMKSKEKLIQAANIELYLGNVKHYCELLFAAGEYDLAVAASPAVSYGFWSEMMKNRAKLHDSDNDIANCLLANGMIDEAVEILLKSEYTDKAFLVAAANRDSSFKVVVKGVNRRQEEVIQPYIDTEFTDADLYLQYMTSSERAHCSLVEGNIYSAACAYLSIGDVLSAEMLLIKHGQTPAAFAIDVITGVHDKTTREKFTLFALQCGASASDIFSVLSKDEKMRLAVALPMSERTALHSRIGIDDPACFLKKVETAAGTQKKIHMLLLGGKSNAALEMLVSFAREHIVDMFAEVREAVRLCEIANLDEMTDPLHDQLVCLSLYFAGYQALWKGYTLIYKRLIEYLMRMTKLNKCEWMLEHAQELRKAIEIMGKERAKTRIYSAGHDLLNRKPLGDRYIPSTMYGKQYFLEDGIKSLRMEEALMWFDVTPFSPTDPNVRHYIM